MIIFSPGPANISERVRKALTLPDICHRDEEFSALLREVKELLARAAGIDTDRYEIAVLSGSGTLAIESCIAALTGWDKTLFVISNGIYGERAADIARVYGVKVEELKLDWGRLPGLTQIEAAVRRPEIGGVYLAHHETTTGLLNPLREIATLTKKYNKIVMADTVSSIIGEEVDFSWGVDVALGTANKCFRGVPGVAFVIGRKDYVNIARKRQRRSYYSDLVTHLDREAKNETPFTPPVHSLFAFREALRETLDEGVANRIKPYRAISAQLREGLKSIGLKLYLPEKLYSNTMTSVYLPAGISFKELHDRVKEKGFVIYNSQGKLQGTVFMLGVVGIISEQNVSDFLATLREVLRGIL